VIRSLSSTNLINNIDNSFLDELRLISSPDIIRNRISTRSSRYSDIFNVYSADEKELAINHLRDLRDSFFVDTDLGTSTDNYGEYEISGEIINKILDLYYENGAHSLPDTL
jgi:hypothetical protein